MDLPILQDITLILGLAVIINLLFQRVRMPAILGFLITGIVCGPHGLNLVHAQHEVDLLSEIGIIFLLFVIGIEFSLKSLAAIKKTVILGGFLQVGGTIGLTTVAAQWFGLSLTEAIFMGFLLSLSSTAIVLKMLQEMGEITSPHGRVSVAILIFQDIIVVPMMLMIPIMGGATEHVVSDLFFLLLKVIVVVVLVILSARYLVPVLFSRVVRTKSRELFILTVVVLCFSTAWLTSKAGLSLALGAFFAGLIISESDYSHQATANIMPFREIFISFFFVSVGMLLDLGFFMEHFIIVHFLAAGVVILKILVVMVAVLVVRYPPRTILLTSLGLFQVGEFSFMLAQSGMKFQLIPDHVYQYFLAISIITMGATPFALSWSYEITDYLLRAPMPRTIRKRLDRITRNAAKKARANESLFHDHVIIIGYGVNGQNVARAARQAGIPFVIVDMDADAASRAKLNDDPFVFGDASEDTILHHIHVHEARVVVIAISDPHTTIRIVERIRAFSDLPHVIVRTRYIREVDNLLRKGADEVIPEEFETSIEIFTRVLKKFLVPKDQIADFIGFVRSGNYDMLRGMTPVRNARPAARRIPDFEVAALTVQQSANRIVGKPIRESLLREEFGITVLAIKREGQFIATVQPEHTILYGDVIYVSGKPDNIRNFNELIELGAGK